jgi:hypothetical protein
MRRYVAYLIIALISVSIGHDAYAGWADVRPCVQHRAFRQGQQRYMWLTFAEITIAYVGDSLEWSANELRYMLRDSALLLEPHVAAIHSLSDSVPYDPDVVIYMGSWEAMSDIFHSTEYVLFQEPPVNEGYYIWVSLNRIYITGSSARAFNYAVTSLWKACDRVASARALERGYIVDYPSFSRRYLGDPTCLYTAYSNRDSASQWETPEQHANGILTLTRDLLLYNKGNGLIHYGKADRYQSGYGYETSIVNALNIIRLGTNGSTSHSNSWKPYRFDWIENFTPWYGSAPPQELFNEIEVEKVCHFHQRTGDTLWVVPSDTVHFDNGDFHEYNNGTGEFVGWEGTSGAWDRYRPSDSSYAHCAIGRRAMVWIEKLFHVQNTKGIPSRLLTLEFSVRAQGIIDVRFAERFNVDSNGFREFIPAGHDDQAGSFFKLDDCTIRLQGATQLHQWIPLHVHFYTLGLPYDSIRLEFSNPDTTTGASVDVDLDNVKIYEADFCHFAPVSDDDSIPKARIYHYDTLKAELVPAEIQFRPLDGITYPTSYQINPLDCTHWAGQLAVDFVG